MIHHEPAAAGPANRPDLIGKVAALLVMIGTTGWLAGCTTSGPVRSSVAAPPAPSIDISRIDEVQDDFPADFRVQAGRSKTFTADDIARTGINVLTEARLDPPHCLPAIIPPYADLAVGTVAAGVTASGAQGGVQVTALHLPHPVTVDAPPAGCDRVAITGTPETTGNAETVAVPTIADATTHGVKLLAAGQTDPDYILTAALDEHTTVVVRGNLAAALNPPQVLSNLLVKAAAAIRGQ